MTKPTRFSEDEHGDLTPSESGFFVLFSDYEVMREELQSRVRNLELLLREKPLAVPPELAS